MSIFLGKVLVFAFVIAGILALVIVLVNIDLQQVNRSLYSLVADVKCSELKIARERESVETQKNS